MGSRLRLWLLLTFFLLLTGTGLWSLMEPTVIEPTVARDTIVDSFPALKPGEAAVLFGGDVLWTRDYRRFTKKHGLNYPALGVLPLIQSADSVAFVANHEGPITIEKKRCPPAKNWNYRSRVRNLKVFPEIGFTHLSLANNHALDRCAVGLTEALGHLDSVGIVSFGAGPNLEAASRPALIDVAGTKVAVIGGMESWKQYRDADWGATKDRAGVFLLQKKNIQRVLKEANESADIVVAFPHWGANYAPVSRKQRRIAERLISAGADVVIGHHGHAAQEFGLFKGKPVLWGLGNLFFGTPGRFGHDKMQPGYGLLARMVLKDGEFDRFELIPIMLNNRLVKFQPRMCTVDEAEAVLATLFEPGSKNVELKDGIAVFRP